MQLSLFLALMMIAGTAPAAEQFQADRIATTLMTRPVSTYQTAHSAAQALKAGMPLHDGDRVATSPLGAATMLMTDGSELRLGANSEMVLRKDKERADGGSLIKLVKGVLQAAVQHLQGGTQFEVRTPSGVAAVKGTEYQIEARGNSTELKVLSGAVELGDPDSKHQVSVKGGEAAESYVDHVGPVRKMNAAEMKALRAAFKVKVAANKEAYFMRIKDLRGSK